MSKITSKDGTSIAFEKLGDGPAVILVDGALCYRRLGPMAPIARINNKIIASQIARLHAGQLSGRCVFK